VIAAVVLAAGLSRRMGQAKLLMKVGRRAIIRYVVESVLAGGVDSVWVVTGPDVEPIEAALAGLDVQVAVNPAPEEGQAGSVRTGIAGETMIEVFGDVQAGTEIVSGPYKALRDLKPGAKVKPETAKRMERR